jgi:hypothetical protein
MNAISPNLINAPGVNVGNVDMAGLYGQQNAQNVAQHNAMLGGIGSIAGAALMAPMTGGGSLFGTAVGNMAPSLFK